MGNSFTKINQNINIVINSQKDSQVNTSELNKQSNTNENNVEQVDNVEPVDNVNSVDNVEPEQIDVSEIKLEDNQELNFMGGISYK